MEILLPDLWAPDPTVDAPGTYEVTLQNIVNGCTATAAVTVGQDTLTPFIQLATPDVLTCGLTQQNLSAAGSDAGSGFYPAMEYNGWKYCKWPKYGLAH